MSCLGRAAVPAKRVWRRISARLGLRRATGLGRLRKEVRTCEYSDVHVMWEMLSSTKTRSSSRAGGGAMDGAAAGKPSGRGSRVGRKAAVAWSRLPSLLLQLRALIPAKPSRAAPWVQTEGSSASSSALCPLLSRRTEQLMIR